jgi:GNAT superfamily N-acetyltransferase
VEVRRLGPGDEPILRLLAVEDADFDVAGRSSPRRPLSDEDAAAYLRDPGVLHWVAAEDGNIVGFLRAFVERRRAGTARQLLLYEMGVREGSRRRGVGTTLVNAMSSWMAEEGVEQAWVLADNPGAEDFYAACGFTRDAEQPVQMTLRLELG